MHDDFSDKFEMSNLKEASERMECVLSFVVGIQIQCYL